jgi:hypothetical protein
MERVDFEIDQSPPGGRTITGTGSHSEGKVQGAGRGRVEGDKFHLKVKWNNGTTGVYNGTFGLDGFISGVTFDERHPSSQATWRSNTEFVR